jgi:HD-like signal output (HDOD) protein/GGDEF domain-containing protein
MLSSTLKRRELAELPEIPSLPRAALKILELVQDPEVDLQKLGRVIEMDPGLTSKIVRLSNSSLFGLSRAVSSIHQALVVLGLRTVKIAALSFTLVDALPQGRGGVQLAAAWRRIIINAMGCRLISRLFGMDSEEAFLAGMMQDIGVLILAKNNPEAYEVIHERALKEGTPISELEMELLGTTHSEVGARLLDAWGMPPMLAEAVARHHDVDLEEALRQGQDDIVVLVAMAESITNVLLCPTIANMDLFTTVSQCFGESSSEVDKFLQRLEIQVQEMSELLDLGLPPGESFEQILLKARHLTEGFRVQNREALPLRLSQELAISRRRQWPLSLLLVRFLKAADSSAPDAKVYEELSAQFQKMVRDCDSLFRLSQDVYCILAPNTPVEGATRMLSRLRERLVQVKVVVAGDDIGHRSLFGLVTVNPDGELLDGEALLRKAIENLREAARNQGFFATVQ